MAMLTPALLTAGEIEALSLACKNPSNSSKQTIDAWIKYLNAANAHLMAGGTLTPAQQEQADFYQEKLDDWRSDYYGQAGL